MPADRNDDIDNALREHLAWWGLRHIESDAAYFAWQREVFTPEDLAALHQSIEAKRAATDGASAEIAFYDLTAQSRFIPALYSQRYEYYLEVGSRIAAQLPGAQTILDAGCGIGLLTTFYAQRCPDATVVGIDRSSASVTRARQRAQELGLSNVRFECLDLDQHELSGRYDLIVATHTLLQAEQDPGLPSRDWQDFTRALDAQAQSEFEQRTGVGLRLDRLRNVLNGNGRMILFEKTRQLARRIPFQRALAARGLALHLPPEPIRYRSIEEVTDDGPLYVTGLASPSSALPWNEAPEPDGAPPLHVQQLRSVRVDPEQPLYENHDASAQQAWLNLPAKQVVHQVTRKEADGRQLHVEWGRAGEFAYLYCANTFDQRQLVVVDQARAAMVETYYKEIVGEQSTSQQRMMK
ncbi:MAG TPA: methyltransferase domain-containing protein [Nitrospira sp.]|nr:methyltransferase domain-containing protein [Nitrospira sp.]